MNFLKNKTKKYEFFHLNEQKTIGVYEDDYQIIKEQLPFHAIDGVSDFILIHFNCPMKYPYITKKFFHYGKRLDYSCLSKNGNKLSAEFKNENLTCYNSNVEKYGDTPLPNDFDPCSLCENELSCMFSSVKNGFKPKDYDTLYLSNILKENGFRESKDMCTKFLVYYDGHRYQDLEKIRWYDIIVFLCFILPLAALILPCSAIWLFIKEVFIKPKKEVMNN